MKKFKDYDPSMLKFGSIDLLLMDPFFVKSLVMLLYTQVNVKYLEQEEPEVFAFVNQIFQEEAIKQKDNLWEVPEESLLYVTDLLDEVGHPIERLK